MNYGPYSGGAPMPGASTEAIEQAYVVEIDGVNEKLPEKSKVDSAGYDCDYVGFAHEMITVNDKKQIQHPAAGSFKIKNGPNMLTAKSAGSVALTLKRYGKTPDGSWKLLAAEKYGKATLVNSNGMTTVTPTPGTDEGNRIDVSPMGNPTAHVIYDFEVMAIDPKS